MPGSTKSCYTGPAGTAGVGACKAGTQVCNAQGTAYGPCMGEVLPAPENCATAADEDCNGVAMPCSGPVVWGACFGSPTDQEGNAVATDQAGNIFLGGYTTSTTDYGCGAMSPAASTDTPTLIKLSPTAGCLWSKVFDVPAANITDQVKALTTDPAGNVYIEVTFFGQVDLGGGLMTSAGASDVAVAKYDPNGVFQWAKRFGSASGESATGIAADATGVYFTGVFAGSCDFGGGTLTSAGGNDIFLVKLSPATGGHVWSKRFGDTAQQHSDGIALDPMGNVLLTGSFVSSIDLGGGALTSAGLNDAFVAKLDAAGNHLWSKAAGASGDDAGLAIASDSAGNVLATGYFTGGNITFGGATFMNQGGNDFWVVKYGPSGNHVWSRAAGGAGNQGGHGIGADPFGNVVVSGALDQSTDFGGGVLTSAGSTDIFLAKYDAATGAHLWSKRFGSTGTDFTRSMAMDPAGNAIITGLTNGPVDFGAGNVCGLGGEDEFLAKFGP